MPQEIEYWCSFCDRREKVVAPTEFATRYGHDVEDAACPDHADAMQFLDDQCPGCVGGWGDCGMYKAIGDRSVSGADIAMILGGHCPYRVNGTASFSSSGFQSIDLSEKTSAGAAFAAAVADAR